MHQRFSLRLPGLHQLCRYQRSWLPGDMLAGITVAAYLIPQCMAYGELVGVPPVVGIWAILPVMVVYGLFGSSRQLSVGPESTTAVMTAVAIAPLVAADGGNYAALASALAILMGIICGIAISGNTVFAELSHFIQQIPQANGVTLLIAGFIVGFLLLIQHFVPKAPGPLFAVLISTAAVAVLHLDRQGVAVVGEIPAGFPALTIPNFSAQLPQLMASAIGIAIVGYSDNVLTARSVAARHHDKIDANQELLALGLANLGTGLMQGFPVSSSASRTAIVDTMGSKTQLCSFVAFGIIVVVLGFLRPILAFFPKAALGGIVIFAALKLIEIPEFIRLYRFRPSEFWLAIVTMLSVLMTDILVGVAIAVGLSVIELLSRLARPHDAVQGTVPQIPGLHDIDDWEGAMTIPGLVIYRYDAPPSALRMPRILSSGRSRQSQRKSPR